MIRTLSHSLSKCAEQAIDATAPVPPVLAMRWTARRRSRRLRASRTVATQPSKTRRHLDLSAANHRSGFRIHTRHEDRRRTDQRHVPRSRARSRNQWDRWRRHRLGLIIGPLNHARASVLNVGPRPRLLEELRTASRETPLEQIGRSMAD